MWWECPCLLATQCSTVLPSTAAGRTVANSYLFALCRVDVGAGQCVARHPTPYLRQYSREKRL